MGYEYIKFGQNSKAGFGLHPDQTNLNFYMVGLFLSFSSKYEGKVYSTQNKILITPLKFDGSLEQGGRRSRDWLREADNNRLYGVGHKNRWDKGALRKSWREKGEEWFCKKNHQLPVLDWDSETYMS